MDINNTIYRLLSGERIRMSYEDYEVLIERVDSGSNALSDMFKNLASDDKTMGIIPVLEAYIKYPLS